MSTPKQRNVKRIYTQLTAHLGIATPKALVDGEESNLPLNDWENHIELIADLEKDGFPIDRRFSLLGDNNGALETGQLELSVLLPDEKKAGSDEYKYPAKGVIYLGLSSDGSYFFPETTKNTEGVVIGGTYGKNTLNAIADLATKHNFLEIRGMHVDADENKHYTSKMMLHKRRHDGSNAGDDPISYPKPLSSDEQTLRSLSNMNIRLDGFKILAIPVYRGIEANMTLDTTFSR